MIIFMIWGSCKVVYCNNGNRLDPLSSIMVLLNDQRNDDKLSKTPIFHYLLLKIRVILYAQ